MSKQAQVGAFAILALLLLFGVFYVITNFGTRHAGYRTGIHFRSAAGLHSGALVYFSGVTIGTVDSITLLPDNTVDVILAISRGIDIPRKSRFLIQAPLTGDPNLVIVPPIGPRRPTAMLRHHVLPVEEQPEGTNTATIADLLEQGQGVMRRLDSMLSDLETREPRLLSTLDQTLANANEMTLTAKNAVATMSGQLQSGLTQASANIVALTGTLNTTTQLNSKRIDDILAQFDQTSRALNTSMASLQELATNKDLKSNVIATTKNIADTTENIAEITHDLRTLTGDPQTQAQLKNTIANLDATMQRANSLLGELGGKSSVYGIDQGATPYPAPAPSGTPYPAPIPSGTPYPTTAQPQQQAQLKSRLTLLARNLIAIQVRISGLSAQQVCCPNPLFSSDQGPQTDLNAVIFPHTKTSVLVGANNVGYNTTANLALLQALSPDLRVGAGVLYSQPGVLAQFNARVFGLEGRFFNPRRPQLDLYGNLNIIRGLQLFVGERAINHEEHRFTYGIQAQFP